jgi:putative membrane protein
VTPDAAPARAHRYPEHRRYLLVLAVLFAILWTALAIDPRYRGDWALENALVAGAVVVIALTYRRLTLSRVSYTLIFLFLCLHEVGAHYTYAEVPYDEWFKALGGQSLDSLLGWERNNFDRVVHFCYGLLLAYPVREIFLRVAAVRGFWGYFLPLDVIMSTSMLYELVEWGAALVVGEGVGQAYLGTQGDEWDAQKDMLLAAVGAVVALAVIAVVHRSLDRDFQREWAESLRVKEPPLGEEALRRMTRDA